MKKLFGPEPGTEAEATQSPAPEAEGRSQGKNPQPPDGPTLWMAELETMHAVFHAFGRTQAEALATLKEGWREHFQRAGLPIPPFHYFEGLVRYVEASYGCAYHDFDLLLARPSNA